MDVRIDLAALDSAGWALREAVENFEHTEEFSADVACTVGHDRLADAVQDFADSWNDRRTALIDQLSTVRDFIVAVHDTFTELDERLAKGVDPAQANPAGAIEDLESYYERRES